LGISHLFCFISLNTYSRYIKGKNVGMGLKKLKSTGIENLIPMLLKQNTHSQF